MNFDLEANQKVILRGTAAELGDREASIFEKIVSQLRSEYEETYGNTDKKAFALGVAYAAVEFMDNHNGD